MGLKINVTLGSCHFRNSAAMKTFTHRMLVQVISYLLSCVLFIPVFRVELCFLLFLFSIPVGRRGEIPACDSFLSLWVCSHSKAKKQ